MAAKKRTSSGAKTKSRSKKKAATKKTKKKAAAPSRRSATKKRAQRPARKTTTKRPAARKKAAVRKKAPARRTVSRAESSRAIARLRRDMASRNETMTDHPYLERVRRFVENRLGSKMTLSRVAGVAGLEETYFSAYFHTTVGLTYSQWLSGLRVIAAVDLMQQGASMEVAARKSGFGHLRTLQRSFKRRLGLPPRAYKSS
jgi:AraC-like DNA-binding protein